MRVRWPQFAANRLSTKFFIVFFFIFFSTAGLAVCFLVQYDTDYERDKLAARVGNQAARATSAFKNQGFSRTALQDSDNRRLARDLLSPLNADAAVECAGLEVRKPKSTKAQPIEIPGQLSCSRLTAPGVMHQIALPIGQSDLRLVVFFSEETIAEEAMVRSQLVIAVMVAALIVAVLSTIMGYKVVVGRRLNNLRRSMRHVSEGGDRHTITPGPPDEIGVLLSAYNALIRSETARQNEIQKAFEEQTEMQAALEQANAELQDWIRTSQSEQRFRDFASSSSDYFWELDGDLKFSFFSERFTELTGFRQEDYLGHGAVEVGLPNAVAEMRERYIHALFNKRAFRDIDFQVTVEDGASKWISISGAPAYDSSQKFIGYRGTGSDITERLNFLDRLNRSERMDALGQLAGGIAHDFNNLLGIIRGHAELIELRGDSPSAIPSVNEIIGASDRGATLVTQLLTFGGKTDSHLDSLDVDLALNALMPLLESAVGDSIDLRLGMEKSIWRAYCDASQFDSAVLNLVLNARDAIASGGVITVRAENHAFPDYGDSVDPPPGEYVCVKVSDTGAGIPEQVLNRMFEPFFTTKRSQGGSGLGLSMVHGFVEQSGGRAIAESELGRGTTISLYLPRYSGDNQDSSTNRRLVDIDGAGQLILIVEDNEALSDITVAYLQRAGYRTLQAGTVHAAMILLNETPDIALVFTDIALPGGLSGTDLANQMTVSFPDIPVIPTSGHAMNVELEGLAEPILTKPYSYTELLERIDHVLKQHLPS